VVVGLLQSIVSNADERKSAGNDSLEGTWKLTSVEINAQSLLMDKLQEGQLVVQGARYSLALGDIRLEMTHDLHANKQPKQLNLTIAEGSDKGKVFHAIYKLEGDRLTICRSIKPDVDRPAEFVSKPDSGLMLVVWTRQEP
jgi:uncharacterized protein (TIGR03067 family)